MGNKRSRPVTTDGAGEGEPTLHNLLVKFVEDEGKFWMKDHGIEYGRLGGDGDFVAKCSFCMYKSEGAEGCLAMSCVFGQ
ncbi:hypothetical protein CBR_g9107 [Chara braunii]|uniref:Uncharacterized protein n=1 Tax=Chara braunii TaxID=69332 RepID=A0A388KNT4_CHABU|nr:hypothetical protein CBR_g9107 [Chara braunii]|eukprot:GBG71695.1 hypothetical protein CBR_g9107 [Chara braunii]